MVANFFSSLITLISHSFLERSFSFFVNEVDLLTHSFQETTLPFVVGSTVVGNISCLQVMHLLYMQSMLFLLHTADFITSEVWFVLCQADEAF